MRTAAAIVAQQPAAEVIAPVTSERGHQVAICHVTDSEATPFELIFVAPSAEFAHHTNHGDVAPVNGVCPQAVVPPPPGEKVAICHRTGSEAAPFEIIEVEGDELPAHLEHGDVALVDGACPGRFPVVPPPPPRRGVLGDQINRSVRSQQPRTPVHLVRPADTDDSSEVQARARASWRSDRSGTLPATGNDVGSLTLVALLLMLFGANLARRGKRLQTPPRDLRR